MKLGLEMPTAYLDTFGPLTNFGFALAQNVLEDEAYAEYYRRMSSAGNMVILDNGLHELDQPLPMPELILAAQKITPTYVIAPDFRKDAEKTLWHFRKMEGLMTMKQTHVGIVLQGAELHDIVQLYSAVRNQAHLISFPYREDRVGWMAELLERYPTRINSWPTPYIHLMGVSTFEDLVWWKAVENAHGFHITVDTAKPIKWGIEGKKLDYMTSMRGSSVKSVDIHKRKDLTLEQLAKIYWNIAYLKNFL